jgi:lipoprotein NlpI
MILAVAAAIGPGPALGQDAANPQSVLDQAVADFEAGRMDASVAGFDRLVELVPDFAPQLWQRGIALYYAGRWADCRAQFESHRTVNPNDVENAVWHYLCVARQESPAAARAALLPTGPDPRNPMAEVYGMFRGVLDPEDVLDAASGVRGEFYAHLYVGLYYEAQGEAALAARHIRMAADERYRAAGGYMHTVARIHAERLGG